MAMNAWTLAKSAGFTVLREQVGVSVAVVASGNTIVLKWKREKPDGTWPTDAEAVQIAVLSGASAFGVMQLRDGRVLIFNGINLFWRTRTNDPKTASDFEAVTVL